MKKRKRIPYGKHFIDNSDIKYVGSVLRSSNLTQGSKVKEFENKIAKYTGAKFAVAVSSCSAGLHLAMVAANVKNKKVITSPISFVSTANAILHAGGIPKFEDIDTDTINLNLKNLNSKIKNMKNLKAIIPVHFSGLACDMSFLDQKLIKKKNIYIVEDAAHALGARYADGEKVGCCKYSDMTVFSFHPVKLIAAGEGGVITTNNKILYEKLLALRTHGIVQNLKLNLPNNSKKKKTPPWYYEMQDLGFHYRITDIQCGLAISQLKKINSFLSKRKEIANYYDTKFTDFENLRPFQNLKKRKFSANHLYVLEIDFNKIKRNKEDIVNALRKKHIYTQVHYIPIYKHPFYKKNFKFKNLKNTEYYYKNCLSIPIFFSLSNNEQKYVINTLKDLIK